MSEQCQVHPSDCIVLVSVSGRASPSSKAISGGVQKCIRDSCDHYYKTGSTLLAKQIFFAAASVYSALLYNVAPIFSCFSHTFITQATGIKPFFILWSRETSKRVFESELMTVGGALEEAAPLMRRTKLCPEPQNSFDSGKTSFHGKSQQRKI